MDCLVDSRVVCRVGHIGDDGHIGLELVGNLSCSQASAFFHDVGNHTNLRLEFLAFTVEQAKGLGHSEGPHSVVECSSYGQIIAQHLEITVNGDGVANVHQCLSFFARTHTDVDE